MSHRRILLALVILFNVLSLFLAPAQPVRAAGLVRYAVPSGGSTTGDCLSWAAACTLTRAIAAASGDEVWVKAGTYTPVVAAAPADADRAVSFTLKNGVAIYGGFAGTETLRSQRDWVNNITTLSGEIGAAGDTDNSYHVVYNAANLISSAVLDGFTITRGNADGSSHPHYFGGGMLNDRSSPTLANLTFHDNSAMEQGGGMFNSSCSPTLTSVTFSDNWAFTGGGGMFNDSSSPTLTNVIFNGNEAASGGGMYNDNQSDPILTSVTFNGNHAVWDGGGMLNLQSSPILTNVTFAGNTVDLYGGGGMLNVSSSPILTNVTFVGNTAGYGGGIADTESSGTLARNTIVWGNLPDDVANDSSEPTFTNSLVGGCILNDVWQTACGTDGGGNLDADPLFVRAPSAGADSDWGTADDDYGNLRLQSASPAIDAGKNDVANPSLPATDLAGRPRIAGGTVDMGAYEWGLNQPPQGIPDSYTADQGAQLSVSTAQGVLANDSDPDPGTTLAAVLAVPPAHASAFTLNADGSFTYTPNPAFGGTNDAFTYRASDGELETAPITATIYVNARPLVNLGADQAINEGETASFSATITDADFVSASWAVAWNYGDGQTAAGGTAATHAYADDGAYTVTAATADARDAQGADTLTVTVSNVAPHITAEDEIVALVGQPFNLNLSFTDPGALDTHTIVIDWAPGVTQTIHLGAGVLNFTASHTYTMFGGYNVQVTVTDKDGDADIYTQPVRMRANRLFVPVVIND